MYGYLLILATFGSTTVVAGSNSIKHIKASVKIARCRAVCLETFQQDHVQITDKFCSLSPDCNMCWDLCFKLFTSYNLYGKACDDKSLCTRGCNTACTFRRHLPPEFRRVKGEFKDEVTSSMNSRGTKLQWKRPEIPSIAEAGDTLVYLLFVRGKEDSNQTWLELAQTANRKIVFDTDELPMPPEFQMLAVSRRRTVARTIFTPESIFVRTDRPKTDVLKESTSSVYVPDVGPLNITLDMGLVKHDEMKLQVSLLWSHPSREVLDCAKSNDYCFYIIDWYIADCEAYPESPPCDTLPYDTAETGYYRYETKPNFTLPDIQFNSVYSVKITIQDTHKDTIEGDLMFKTPLCRDVDYPRTGCLDSLTSFKKNNPVLLGPDATEITPNDVNQVFETTTEMDISSLFELKIDENPKMTYDTSTNMMDVNITWSTALNKSVFDNYIVTWYEQNVFQRPNENKTNKNNLMLRLETDRNYIITVTGFYRDDNNVESQISAYLDLVTQKNLSSSNVVAQPLKKISEKHDLSTLSGVIVAVVVATILIIAGFVVLFYKKRKSFKDIIITKTFVTKSNSYKSNVGAGKSNYSNQLMVISDEWELDPKLLKFSTPLGQGAFGKVVTGYCNDKKVAIKLVKEGAPVSYKEDLVAEINLMKRIGSNPNIVSMIGACTLCEPIALVMEFIPHGNLQNFLKKCRLEGDLRKRSDGASEIAYSMVHDTGDIENYLITPADMLSFARQVAMAMEYLTDRKYVHRDLAARNVLLGQNKVVKLCDFGLSRDIYNDNQYKKLTNGKLPLKWMAIESLRDRVFTTHSDVWSFGVLLWEIVTMGASPYPHIALSDLYYVLVNGYRMEKTSNCSDELYAIMLHCWAALPQERPCFTQLRLMLEELLEQDRDYLVLENINVPLNTSENSSSPSSMDDMSAQPSAASSGILVAPTTKDKLRVNVCIHEKSTDRLLRKSESDSSP